LKRVLSDSDVSSDSSAEVERVEPEPDHGKVRTKDTGKGRKKSSHSLPTLPAIPEPPASPSAPSSGCVQATQARPEATQEPSANQSVPDHPATNSTSRAAASPAPSASLSSPDHAGANSRPRSASTPAGSTGVIPAATVAPPSGVSSPSGNHNQGDFYVGDVAVLCHVSENKNELRTVFSLVLPYDAM